MTSPVRLYVPAGTTVQVIEQGAPPPAALFLDLEMTDVAAINAAAGGSFRIAQPFAFDPVFGVEPTGLKYLQFTISAANGPRGISWFLPFGERQEVYFAYPLWIGADVKAGMTEIGVKLPGPDNEQNMGPTLQPELLSLRLEHGKNDPANPGTYPFKGYFYDAETGAAATGLTPMLGGNLREGWNWITGRMKENGAPGVADGIIQIKLDDVLIYDRQDVRFETIEATTMSGMHVNVYHGGMGVPTSPITYRIGPIQAGPQWIPRPANVPVYVPPPNPGPWPAWRNNKPVDVVFPIPMTSNMGGTTTNRNTIDDWNGLGSSPDSLYSMGAGGHSGSTENKVQKLNLKANAPDWVLLHPGSAVAGAFDQAYYPDGIYASRHTYFTTQVLPSLNRVMLFTSYGIYGNGGAGFPHVDGFDLSTNQPDPAGTFPDSPAYAPVMAVARDPRTDDVYVAGGNKFAKFTAATKKWALITPASNASSWEFKNAFVDASRNQLITLNTDLVRIELTTKAVSRIVVTGPLAGASADYQTTVHDTDNDRYLTVKGSTLYAVNPTTGASIAIASVPAATNGVNGRLHYHADVGGVSYLPNFASNVLFMPTR